MRNLPDTFPPQERLAFDSIFSSAFPHFLITWKLRSASDPPFILLFRRVVLLRVGTLPGAQKVSSLLPHPSVQAHLDFCRRLMLVQLQLQGLSNSPLRTAGEVEGVNSFGS